MAKVTAFILCTLFLGSLIGQNIEIDGYVYESGNRGFLDVVQVTVFDGQDQELGKTFTDRTGHFTIKIPARFKYRIATFKDMFVEAETMLNVGDTGDGDKLFAKIEMKRAPGYTFEITLAEKRDHDSIVVDAIKGSRIEVYNNTKKTEVLVLEQHPEPHFDVALQKGNHYTILIRKDGYLGKRMEAFVDVEGCILCFEGIGSVNPGVSDNLTEGNEFGVLLANVELDKIYEGKTIPISNITYANGKANLNKSHEEGLLSLATIMKDNPDLTIEIGAHTDSRGKQEDNLNLSRERAKNVVDFLVNDGVAKSRLISKGYGESKLLNDCTSFVDCPDRKHRVNRRTELKVIGIAAVKAPIKTLAQIKQLEQGEALLEEIQFGGVMQVPLDSISEAELKDLEGDSESEKEEAKDSMDTANENATANDQESKEVDPTEETSTDVEEENSELQEMASEAIYSIVIHSDESAIAEDNELYNRHSFLTEHEYEDKFIYTIGDYTKKLDAQKFLRTAKIAYADAYLVRIEGDKIIKE